MRIDGATKYLSASERVQNSGTAARTESCTSVESDSQAASRANAVSANAADIQQIDFTNMSRQQLWDWMNGKIRSGEMSLTDSAPFMAMTIKVSTDGQPVALTGDSERINFMEKARLGIEGAMSRNDPKEAKTLQAALDTMRRFQGQATGVDAYA